MLLCCPAARSATFTLFVTDHHDFAEEAAVFHPPVCVGAALEWESLDLRDLQCAQEDRLDLICARTLGDPEHFWRICDANDAMNPFDLTGSDAVGQPLRIPVPQP